MSLTPEQRAIAIQIEEHMDAREVYACVHTPETVRVDGYCSVEDLRAIVMAMDLIQAA